MAKEKLLIDLWSVNMNEVDTSDCTDVEDILSAVISYLSELPTVDAVEVVHGRWIEKVDLFAYYLECCTKVFYECSECNGANIGKSPYCPNCGAKMDEETKFVGICEHCVYRDECDWPKLHPKIKLKECPDFKEGEKNKNG